MQAIKKKLRSQRGASLTFALLIFLVCAVLSSVIIVAATTAVGRMSRLAERDQKYYAVTSAAELMKDLLKEPVSIVKRTETTTVTETTSQKVVKETKVIVPREVINEAGETVIENAEVIETETTFPDSVVNETSSSKTTEYLLLKEGKSIDISDFTSSNKVSEDGVLVGNLTSASMMNDAAYSIYKSESKEPSRTIHLTSSVDTMIAVDIEEKIMPKTEDRYLILTIHDAGDDADHKPYTLELTFAAELTDTPGPEEETTNNTVSDTSESART